MFKNRPLTFAHPNGGAVESVSPHAVLAVTLPAGKCSPVLCSPHAKRPESSCSPLRRARRTRLVKQQNLLFPFAALAVGLSAGKYSRVTLPAAHAFSPHYPIFIFQ